jgi:universal stress protein E
MRIVVGLDGSDQAMAALSIVAALPLSDSDEVILVSVAEPHERLGNGADTERQARYAIVLERSWAQRRAAARRVVEQARGTLRLSRARISTRVLSGHPVEAISSLAREVGADLIAVGTRGRGLAASMFLGSVAQSLLAAADRPVLVARPPAAGPRRVLVAVDGSAHSDAAVGLMATIPMAPDARVDIVVVAAGGRGTVREIAATIADQAADRLRAAGRLGAVHVRAGDVRREILGVAEAEQADLIVLGSRGLGGFLGLPLGSVPHAVVASARCSVLVVPLPSSRPG